MIGGIGGNMGGVMGVSRGPRMPMPAAQEDPFLAEMMAREMSGMPQDDMTAMQSTPGYAGKPMGTSPVMHLAGQMRDRQPGSWMPPMSGMPSGPGHQTMPSGSRGKARGVLGF